MRRFARFGCFTGLVLGGLVLAIPPAEEFSVVLWQGENKKQLPLAVDRDQKPVPYPTIALQATDAPDSFVLEARCGPHRGTLELKVPAVTADHAHSAP